ncbi:MAG: DUF4124 domain-containing protein [Gammaproteobacteria bacterium]|jgi:hypothetical protein
MGVLSKMRIRFQNSVVLLALLGLAVFCAGAQAGGIYKWVDKEGNVHYSQDPQHLSDQPMNIKVPKSSSSQETASSKEESPTAAEPQTGDAGQTEEQKALEEAAARKQQEAGKKNCQTAMKRFATITAGGRIYEVDEQGERVYWDDNTRQAKLAEAQQDVDKWCGQE